ncbi:hypothetical protein [Bradyrhizobium sp.]|uniref:hypothetical protein n=1 Tax=Bradyrhizobium sp. TaxID=376 RepID=UPI00391B390E
MSAASSFRLTDYFFLRRRYQNSKPPVELSITHNFDPRADPLIGEIFNRKNPCDSFLSTDSRGVLYGADMKGSIGKRLFAVLGS